MKVILSIDNGLAEFHSYANGRELAGKVPFANTECSLNDIQRIHLMTSRDRYTKEYIIEYMEGLERKVMALKTIKGDIVGVYEIENTIPITALSASIIEEGGTSEVIAEVMNGGTDNG